MGVEDVVIPVVGECDDSWLNDARVVQVKADDVSRALADAEVAAEVVGGRRRRRHRDGVLRLEGRDRQLRAGWTEGGHAVGVLVLANFGVSSGSGWTACRSAAS